MTEPQIRRAVRVAFSASGAKKLDAQINKVDTDIKRTGNEGSAALGKADAATVKMAKSMEAALQPIDESFKGFDRLNSIVGKLTMVGGLASLAWTGITKAIELFKPAADSAVLSQDALNDSVSRASSLLGAYAKNLTRINALQLMSVDEAYTKALERSAQNLGKIREATSELEKAQFRLAITQAAYREALKTNDATEVAAAARRANEAAGRVRQLRDVVSSEQARTAALSSATERAARDLETLTRHYSALGTETDDVAEKADRAAAAVARVVPPAQTLLQIVQELAAPSQSLADAIGAQSLDPEPLLRLSEAFPKVAAGASAMADAVKAASLELALQRSEMEATAELAGVAARGYAAMAYESLVAGDSFSEFANKLARSVAQQAAVEAVYYGAKALVAAGTGIFTGNPAMFAAAESFTAAAAGMAAVAGVAAGVASQTGGLTDGGGAGSGSSGPSIESSRDMTGAPAQPSGPTVVNLNLAGAWGAVGRALIEEINREGQRLGGARITAQAVRR